MVEISEKSKRIAKGKIKGLKTAEIAKTEYPDATKHSGEVLVSRELKKTHVAQYYSKELSKTLKHYGITKSQYFQNIGLAMVAEKQNQFTGEITPDVITRLAGNKAAERFLFKDEKHLKENKAIKEALESDQVDELQLIRVLKNKE